MIVEWAKNFVSFHFFFKCLFFLLSFCVYQPYRYSYIVWADKLSQMHLVIFRDMVWDETRGSNQCSVGIPLKESRPCVDRVPQLALVNVPPKTTHKHTMLDVHFLRGIYVIYDHINLYTFPVLSVKCHLRFNDDEKYTKPFIDRCIYVLTVFPFQTFSKVLIKNLFNKRILVC